MRLYALRHGETSWNVQRRFQGQSDIPLNDKGILLAELTGEGLANVPFDLAFTSPLCRARQTAELVLAGREPEQAAEVTLEEGARQVLALKAQGAKTKDAVRQVADATGLGRNELYAAAVAAERE